MKEHIIDAKGKRLGRLASEIACILQGKKNPSYEPRLAGSDRVTVKNIHQIEITKKKMEQRIYYKHTGPLGHLKRRTLGEKFEKNPAQMLRNTVRGMLPKNRLQQPRLKRLIIEKVDKE